jgi:hypothetical protein
MRIGIDGLWRLDEEPDLRKTKDENKLPQDPPSHKEHEILNWFVAKRNQFTFLLLLKLILCYVRLHREFAQLRNMV